MKQRRIIVEFSKPVKREAAEAARTLENIGRRKIESLMEKNKEQTKRGFTSDTTKNTSAMQLLLTVKRVKTASVLRKKNKKELMMMLLTNHDLSPKQCP